MPDIEIVNLEERAKLAIQLGESHFREFKSALQGTPNNKSSRKLKDLCRDIAESLVAFANADGGELIVGVEDDGTISGITNFTEQHINALQNAPKTHVLEQTPLPHYRTATITLDDYQILYFSIQKSVAHVHLTSDGRCVQRRDLETVPIPTEDILFDRQERVSREYDRQYEDSATTNDLDENFLSVVAEQISPGMSIEKCLQYLDLAEYMGPGLRLRKGALLLFAKEAIRWHPRLQLRIMKIEGTELKSGAQYNVTSDQTVSGNILEMVERGWEALRPQLVQTRLGGDARFNSTVMYPELACREALVNAISHRDYSEEGRGIEVYIFDDRMEVRNPGALLSSISVEDLMQLKGAHQSRNTVVARVLREVGYMRELGEGMRRMFLLMRQNELTPPELESSKSSFSVTLRHQTIYNRSEELWLDNFQRFNLTREQKAIVVLGIGDNLVAPQNIWDRLGIVDTEHYRQLIKSLQDLGILHSEIPKQKAQSIARSKKTGVRNIPRFKISIPRPTGERRKGEQIGPARRRRKKAPREDSPNEEAKLWIGNLPSVFDETELYDFLSQFGEVQQCEVPKGTPGGGSRGFAFVEYQSPDAARRARQRMEGRRFGGKFLVTRRASPRRRS